MNSLQQAVREYLAMRRSLGFKLQSAGPALLDFVSFLEQRRAPYITAPLALAWAKQTSSEQSDARAAQRLSYVRLLARYRSATDPRTEIPPAGLLPFRPQRARPYLYSDKEIRQLLQATLDRPLSPHHRERCAIVAVRLLLFIRAAQCLGFTPR
jgi:integrase/recombinase XerD